MAVGQLNQVDDSGNDESVDIADKIESLENRFDSLRTQIRSELCATPNITVETLLDTLTSLPLALKKEYESSIEKALKKEYGSSIEKCIPNMAQVNKLFIRLNPLLSFIDYSLIEFFIKKYGSEALKKDMRSYCSEMKIFMKETTIKQLINHLPGQPEIPPKFSLVEAKLGQDASKCTLEQLNTIRKRYCSEVKLSEIVFHLVAILDSNSFIVRWLVPSVLISDIMGSTRNIQHSLYQECKITFLTLDAMWLFLSETEIDTMWSQVRVGDAKSRDLFHTMYKQIVCELKIGKISEDELSSYLMERQPKLQRDIGLHLISKAFLERKFPLSLADFKILTTIIERFGSDCLKSVMKFYCNRMSISTVQQLMDLSPVQSKPSEYFIIAECRIMEEPSDYRIEKLLRFQTKFCNIVKFNEACFVINEIITEMSDSFIVRWLVPSALVFDIMKSTRDIEQSFYQDYKITSLTLGAMWLFLSEAEIKAMFSQVHVSDTKIKDLFHSMYKQIVYVLKMGRISEDELSSCLMDQPPKLQKDVALHLSEAFLEDKFPLSLVDFKILTIIIEWFGSDCLKSVMKSFYKCFTMQSSVQELIDLSPVHGKPSEDFITAECRILEEPSDYRLENLLSFRMKFCNSVDFNEVCFVISQINTDMSGSFIVRWLVPSALVCDIMKSVDNVEQSLYQKHKITSFTLDAMWLFLSEAEIDAMFSQVHMSDTKIKDLFQSMYIQIVYELKMGRISADKLSSYLMNQKPKLRRDVGLHLSEAFLERKFPLSLVDFKILTIIIERFGSDCLKSVMKSYCNYMSIYAKQSTVQQLMDLSPVQSKPSEYFVIAECRIVEEPSDYRIEKLLRFQTKFCNIFKFNEACFVMSEINTKMSGSFTVRWLVPSALVSDIMKSASNVEQGFYQEYKITSFTLDAMWLFVSEAEIDAMFSQVHMSDTKIKDLFHSMYKQIVYELKMRRISADKLSSYLMDQKPKLRRDVGLHLSEAFLERKFPLSLVDFKILTIIIERFGSDCLKSVMKSYCNYVSIYAKQSTVQQLMDLSPVQSKPSEYFVIAECRIVEEPSDYRIEKLLRFQTKFCNIFKFNEACFVMSEINTKMSGSFTVRWLVPSALVSDIMKSVDNVEQSLYQKHKITSFTLDAMWLFVSEAEIDAMFSQVHMSDTKIKDLFHSMYKQIVYELKMRRISEDKLSSCLMDQKPKLRRDVGLHLSEAFLERKFPLSLVDFKILTIIIERFGSDCLKSVMKSYCNYVSIYAKQSTVQQLMDLSPVQSKPSEYFVIAECRIVEEPSDYRIEKLLRFQTKFCNIFKFNEACFVMSEINTKMSGSFTVRWLVPSALVSDIMKSASNVEQGFYQEYKITSFILDAMWLYISEPEVNEMWSQVHVSETKSRESDLFHTMYKQIMFELEMEEISKYELSSYLMDQQPKLRSDVSLHLSEAFLKGVFFSSLVDFRMHTIIIERFGSDCLKSVMKSYCNYNMSIFTKQSTARQLINLSPLQSKPSEYFITAECRIMEEPSDYILENLLGFQTQFCTVFNCSNVCFVMGEIYTKISGSFTVSWLIPSSIAFDLLISANQIEGIELFQKFNIASLHLGSGWLYNHQLTPFGAKLKDQYQMPKGSPPPIEWIPSPTKKIFRLAMIQRERVQRGHIEDRFVRMTISGRVDDILHAKSPVELKHLFKNTLHGSEIILIEGAPGSGKSTLTVHMCQRWGKRELFQQFTVVILVQLRDPAVQKAQTIANLLPVKNLAFAQELATELIATNGRGVLWVLDGWDELPTHLQQDSIFRKLIQPIQSSKHMLPQPRKKRLLNECSVIITSRPISSVDLHPVVSSRIEVLGFTPEEQWQYFNECLKGDTKALEALLEKIQENPMVQSICYLPLNAAFVVHSFKLKGQVLANTVYEIYSIVILNCIQRHFEREGRGHDLPRELASLDDLSWSRAVREPFQCLCELSYRGVMTNKVTFSSSDLPQGSNTLSLLQAIESFLQSGKSVFYNFLHLSIQELLSAYYIATWLSDSEQVSQFQQLFNQPRFAAVFQFYSAITKLKSPGIHQVIARIVEEKSKPLLVSLLHCLYEARDPSLCLYIAGRLGYELDLSDTSLSPLDCLSISFFLSSVTDKAISVDLWVCSIGDLGADCLAKYLGSDADDINKVTINLYGNKIHKEGASHISRMLSFIKHLYLSANPIGDTGVSLISEAVRDTVTLKTLILSSCGITSRGAEDLSEALAKNRLLEKLDIDNNDLGDEGISHMAEALKQNTQLKELWIGVCGMTDKGAASLASALSVNNSLKMLHMGGEDKGPLTEDGLSTITQSLPNNSEFVKLVISDGFNSAIALRLKQEVNKARKRNGFPLIKIEGEY